MWVGGCLFTDLAARRLPTGRSGRRCAARRGRRARGGTDAAVTGLVKRVLGLLGAPRLGGTARTAALKGELLKPGRESSGERELVRFQNGKRLINSHV